MQALTMGQECFSYVWNPVIKQCKHLQWAKHASPECGTQSYTNAIIYDGPSMLLLGVEPGHIPMQALTKGQACFSLVTNLVIYQCKHLR